MKLNIVLTFFLLVCSYATFAEAQHAHPHKNSHEIKQTTKSIQWPGACEVEIFNNSYQGVRVYGEFDDGAWLRFSIPPYDAPHRISLFYYGYCHRDLYLSLDSYSGYHIYSGFAPVDSRIEVYSYYANQLETKVTSR